MNVREEDRQKNSCPSRGLGLAAAAIGVGVGAALYYFFSKGPENPGGEGSTTSGWSCEQPHALEPSSDSSEDSYITISEHSTTDTSIETDSLERSYEDSESDESMEVDSIDGTPVEVDSDDTNDWDITNSSLGVPDEGLSPMSPMSPVMMFWGGLSSLWVHQNTVMTRREEQRRAREEELAQQRNQALYEEEQLRILRDQHFRERSWSLEECSICFDIILKDQQVTTLPCTHHFHSACITPWLQEQQTCPNCRKAAE